MKCIKCGGGKFIIESTLIVTEIYDVLNSGKVSPKPSKIITDNQDMAEYDNQLRCTECKQAYVVDGHGRNELLEKDYQGFDLTQVEVELSEY